jgi:hypothetical protein
MMNVSKYVSMQFQKFINLIYFSIFQTLTKKWNEVRQLVPQRDSTLQNEYRKQQNNEMLRRQFAEKANQVGPWIEKQLDAVTAIGMGLQVMVLNMKTCGSHLKKFIFENLKKTGFFGRSVTSVKGLPTRCHSLSTTH